MKLIITDFGDPSVGIFSATYSVDCPFEVDDTDKESIDFFREAMCITYGEFAQGKLVAEYDFEIENREFDLMENEDLFSDLEDTSFFKDDDDIADYIHRQMDGSDQMIDLGR